jgi:3-oxoacyl-[acyl-carrier protein] reductase
MTPSPQKVALVTGAARGIGLAVAKRFLAEGWRVALLDIEGELLSKSVEALANAANTLSLQCDVSDASAVAGAFTEIGRRFGRLDALVNNAGTTTNVGPKDFDAMTAEEWDRVFAVNVRGTFQVTRAAVALLRNSGGSVVNTASIVGLRPGPQPLPYAASKAAIVNLTRLLALNLGPEIRVNAVAPGWMEGDWMERMLGERYDDLMGRRAKATPLKRVITADDVAEVILNLVTSNRMVNGETIVIDGGFAATT